MFCRHALALAIVTVCFKAVHMSRTGTSPVKDDCETLPECGGCDHKKWGVGGKCYGTQSGFEFPNSCCSHPGVEIDCGGEGVKLIKTKDGRCLDIGSDGQVEYHPACCQ